ncbi:hypothetical protein KDD17_01645 [Sulfitobacter albidus]|uniref:Condensation domain-containing protein n=1 Tax=Sulfitobacter albidus TaxID=2829501 RepID=A0A975JE55_9RHOB|nr:condensation domain-containing protein [Sulfitobacter albidus]QUJ76793.1 hypothetical protein KDD17_01645 [Sulfitobacter albidus]
MTQNNDTPTPPKRFSRARLREVQEAQSLPIIDRGAGPFPAAPVQKMFWLLSQVEQAGSAYVIRAAFDISGKVDADALARAFAHLAHRHEILCARFEMRYNTLVVDHADPANAFPLTHSHLSQHADVQAELTRQAAIPMDLQKGPLAQAHLWTRAPDAHTLMIRLHHTVADDASIDILWHDLTQIYAALVADDPVPAPAATAAYLDVAQHQAVTGSDDAYWRRTLAGSPPLSTPAGDTRPRLIDHAGAVHRFDLGTDLVDAIAAFATKGGVTPFAVALAAWVIFLQNQSGQRDIVTSVPVSQRDTATLAHTVGPLLNTLALRVDHRAQADGIAFVKDVHDRFLTARAHAGTPINQVIELSEPARSAAHHPLFQTMFSWISRAATAPLSLGDLPAHPRGVHQTTAQLDLTLDLVAEGAGISCAFEYATCLFDADTVASFAQDFTAGLERLVTTQAGSGDARPAARISLPRSSSPETAPPVPERFAMQATRTPDAPALVDGGTW